MIVTLCGARPNDCDCGYCLRMQECQEAREAICRGCTREYLCPLTFKRKRAEAGECKGREMRQGP